MSFLPFQRSDARVVRSVLAGQREEFGVLVDRYFPAVQAIAYAHTGNHTDAADIAQETFLCAYQKLNTLREGEKFRAWIGSIARHLAQRFREKRRHEIPLSAQPEQAVESIKPEEREMQELVRRMIDELEESPREVLALHYFAGKSLREIAEIQGVSREAAAKRLQRAREVLGEKLLARLQPQAVEKTPLPIGRKKAIMAAIAAAPAAWEAAAGTMAAGSASAGLSALLSGKILAAALGAAVTVTAAVTLWQYAPSSSVPDNPAASKTDSSAALTANFPANAVQETPVKAEDTVAAASAGKISQETGPGRLTVRVFDMKGNPAANAEGYVERVNWKPAEMPPAETVKRFGHADAEGTVEFRDLPLGEYGVVMYAPGGVDVNEDEIAEKRLSEDVQLNLKPSFPLGGTLLDADGQPVEGAVLYPHRHILAPDQELPSVSTAVARQMTGPDGKFRFPSLWPGSYAFYVQAKEIPGFVTEYLPVNSEDSVIRLPRGCALGGRVYRTDNGAPVSGVHVYFSPDETQRARVPAVSGDDGSFSIAQLCPGVYNVRLDDAVMVGASNDLKVTLKDGQSQTFDIPVREGSRIIGKVIDQSSGAPISGVKAHVYDRQQSIWRESAPSDALGAFAFLGLPGGTYQINLSDLKGFCLRENDEKDIKVQAGEEQEVTFTLTPGTPVSGVVIDAAGQPVAHANVHARNEGDGPGYYGDAETDGQGRFHMAEGPPAPRLCVWAEKDDWYSHVLGPQPLPEEGLEGLSLTLDLTADARLEGKVKAAAALEGLAQFTTWYHVSLEPKDTAIPKTPRAKTQAAGVFRMPKVIPGSYTMILEKGPYYEKCAAGEITLAAGEAKTGIEVQCGSNEAGTLSISGHVVDKEGKPILGAEVYLQSDYNNRTRTGFNGEFAFSGLTESEYVIQAGSPKHSTKSIPVNAGDAEVEIVLPGRGSISGRVVDAQSGRPVEEFAATSVQGDYAAYGSNPWNEKEQRVHDPEGKFTLGDLQMGTNSVRIRAAGYATYAGLLPELEEGAAAPEATIPLEPGATVAGIVTDTAQRPVSGAKIFAGNYSNNAEWEEADAISGEDGRFEIGGLDQEGDILCAYHKGFAPAWASAAPGNVCSITLTASGTIRGTISLREPSEGACAFVSASQEQWPLKTSLAGTSFLDIQSHPASYTLENLPAGETTLMAGLVKKIDGQSNSYRNIMGTVRKVIVVPGQTTEANIEFGPANASIEGSVTINGKPMENAHVFLRMESDPAENNNRMESAENGTFRFEDLPACSGQLEVDFAEASGTSRVKRVPFSLSENQALRRDIDFSGDASVTIQVSGIKPGWFGHITLYEGAIQPEEEALLFTDYQQFFERTEGRSVLMMRVMTDGPVRAEDLPAGLYTAVLLVAAPDTVSAAGAVPGTHVALQAFELQSNADSTISMSLP